MFYIACCRPLDPLEQLRKLAKWPQERLYMQVAKRVMKKHADGTRAAGLHIATTAA
jgi:hypothetical protein